MAILSLGNLVELRRIVQSCQVRFPGKILAMKKPDTRSGVFMVELRGIGSNNIQLGNVPQGTLAGFKENSTVSPDCLALTGAIPR